MTYGSYVSLQSGDYMLIINLELHSFILCLNGNEELGFVDVIKKDGSIGDPIELTINDCRKTG